MKFENMLNENGDSESGDFDESIVELIYSNSYDVGDGEIAFCMDAHQLSKLGSCVETVDVEEVDSKEDLACNPLGRIADELIDGVVNHDLVDGDDGLKYCIVMDKQEVKKSINEPNSDEVLDTLKSL